MKRISVQYDQILNESFSDAKVIKIQDLLDKPKGNQLKKFESIMTA
jgi:hypothetical protein